MGSRPILGPKKAMSIPSEVKRVTDTIWEVPVSHKEGMRVPARIYATEKLMGQMDAGVIDQVTNVATLPGILKYAYCMPDAHWGYGFPIGGVAATDAGEGVISPGGVGFDINCGMRLVRTNLTHDEVKPHLKKLVDSLFKRVPAGVGCKGFVRLSHDEFRTVVEQGSAWCIQNGYGWEEDLDLTEERGCISGSDAGKISQKAVERGFNQIGTLGSGNHYLEIQVARPEYVYDKALAKAFGIEIPNQVVVMFHCGSRGFGHQVATDYLRIFLKVMQSKYGIQVRDRELACAPFRSPEGQDYFAGMNCGLNMSFANRQVILHRIREVFADVMGRSPEEMDMHMIYDVSHNTAKLEQHLVNGEAREVVVHRKGATRSFASGMPDVPERYAEIGQPVIIGGSMETGSYLLVGVPGSAETFYSTAHGSGRAMSRTRARKQFRGRDLQRDMEERGIYVKAASFRGLAEEAGGAYKDIDEVVEATTQSDISRPVARFVPIGNVKG